MFTAKNYLNFASAALMLAASASLTSCDNSFLYDDLPPCQEAKFAVRFYWTKNMIGADGFSNNIRSVDLYVFDENDKYVTCFSERGEILSMQGYTMPLEGLKPGKYNLVAWCGLENEGTRAESFSVNNCVPGQTSRRELFCKLRAETLDDGTHHSSEELYDLYHGTAYEIEIFDPSDKENYSDMVYPISLTKDTNTISVLLQNLSGDDLDITKFSFQLEDNNGTLTNDNELGSDEVINYHEFETFEGTAGVDIDTRGTRAIQNVKTGMANIKVSRLMENHMNYLTIRNTEDNHVVGTFPIVQYALLGKFSDAGREMDDQDYLDSQDTYRLTLFLEKTAGQWMTTQISINSWTIIDNKNDF